MSKLKHWQLFLYSITIKSRHHCYCFNGWYYYWFRKLLITGFDPFGGESVHPAWEAGKLIDKNIQSVQVQKVEITTVFRESTKVLTKKIKEYKPDVIICVGQAEDRYDIPLKRVTINVDDARISDNQGNQPIDETIYEDWRKRTSLLYL